MQTCSSRAQDPVTGEDNNHQKGGRDTREIMPRQQPGGGARGTRQGQDRAKNPSDKPFQPCERALGKSSAPIGSRCETSRVARAAVAPSLCEIDPESAARTLARLGETGASGRDGGRRRHESPEQAVIVTIDQTLCSWRGLCRRNRLMTAALQKPGVWYSASAKFPSGWEFPWPRRPSTPSSQDERDLGDHGGCWLCWRDRGRSVECDTITVSIHPVLRLTKFQHADWWKIFTWQLSTPNCREGRDTPNDSVCPSIITTRAPKR